MPKVFGAVVIKLILDASKEEYLNFPVMSMLLPCRIITRVAILLSNISDLHTRIIHHAIFRISRQHFLIGPYPFSIVSSSDHHPELQRSSRSLACTPNCTVVSQQILPIRRTQSRNVHRRYISLATLVQKLDCQVVVGSIAVLLDSEGEIVILVLAWDSDMMINQLVESRNDRLTVNSID